MMTMKTMNKEVEWNIFKWSFLTYIGCGLLLSCGILSMFGIITVIPVMLAGAIALLCNANVYIYEEFGIFLVDDKKK